VVYPVLTNEEMTIESQRYNCCTRNGGNSIPKHAGPEAEVSKPLDLPCLGPVTHSREVLTTGKSHGKKPDRRTCEPNLLTNNYLISFECTTITREMSERYYKLVLNGN